MYGFCVVGCRQLFLRASILPHTWLAMVRLDSLSQKPPYVFYNPGISAGSKLKENNMSDCHD